MARSDPRQLSALGHQLGTIDRQGNANTIVVDPTQRRLHESPTTAERRQQPRATEPFQPKRNT